VNQRFTRRVESASPFHGMNNKVRWRLTLECGHTVARGEAKATARCEECAALSPDGDEK